MNVGRYQLLGELGRGGMGTVLLGYDPLLKRKVAIKTVRTDSAMGDPQTLQNRLLREAEAAAKLRHPGIVAMYDVVQDQGAAHLVMEFVDGRTLVDLFQFNNVLDPALALRILAETADALDHAHVRNIIHRDIKPGNIMLDQSGAVRITDFGIAKIIGAQTQTVAGSTIGTLEFMSPEQLAGDPVDGRADQFALAVLAYRMLTGHPIYDAVTLPAMCYKIAVEPPPPASRMNPRLPPGVDAALAKGLAKKPGERYATCSEFAWALRKALTPRQETIIDPLPLPVPPPKPARAWIMIAILLSVVAAIGIVIAVVYIARTRATSASAAAAFQQGLRFFEQAKYPQATTRLDESLRLSPWEIQPRAFRAWLGCNGDQPKYGGTVADHLLNEPDGHARGLWVRGFCRFKQNDPNRALTDLNDAIRLDPAFAEAYTDRGTVYNSLKNYDQALQDFNKAIELRSNYALAYKNRGIAFWGLKQNDRAIEDANKAIALNPDYAGAYNNRGLAYENLKQHERAIQDFDKAIELKPDLEISYYNRGMSYGQLNQWERAIQDFTQAINLKPDYELCYFRRGYAYGELHQYERAIENYNKVIEFRPDGASAYNNRALAYDKLQQHERALQDYDKAIELKPDEALYYTNRAIVREELGDKTGAEADREKARSLKGS